MPGRVEVDAAAEDEEEEEGKGVVDYRERYLLVGDGC